MNGTGKLLLNDGSYYIGDFLNNKFLGNGDYFDKDGSLK